MITLLKSTSLGIHNVVEYNESSTIFKSFSAGIYDKRKYKGMPVILKYLSVGVKDNPVVREGKILRVK
jgi:hypothetical protein